MKVFKPRRGTTYTMTQTDKKNTILAKGELFIEVPNGGAGTGPSIIKLGDGIHKYDELPVAISGVAEINVIESESSTTAEALNNVTSGSTPSVLFGELKKAISLNLDSINEINNNIPFPLGIKNNKYGYYTAKSNGNFIEFASPADITNGINNRISGVSPIKVLNGNITHENSGVTANTYGPTQTSAVSGSNGTKINIPKITVDARGHVTSVSNIEFTAVNTSATYSGTAPISVNASTGVISHSTSGVTAGTYGPSANVTGSNSTTINIPQITVDAKGHVTGITNRVYTSVNTDSDTKYSAGTGMSLSGTSFSVKYGTAAGTACQGNDSRLSNARTPVSHASTATTYGVGDTKNYGHLKLWNDIYSYPEGEGYAERGGNVSLLRDLVNSTVARLTALVESNSAAIFEKIDKTGGTFSGNVVIYKPGAAGRLTLGNNVAAADGSAFYEQTASGIEIRGYNRGTGFYTSIRHNGRVLDKNRNLYLPNDSGTIQFGSGSSRKIKENIRDMVEERAKKILDLNIVNFDYIGNFCGGLKDQSGIIAEDAIDIIPEAVYIHENYDPDKPVDEDTNPSPEVDYRKFVPYLIKMVQIQQKEINELKEALNK